MKKKIIYIVIASILNFGKAEEPAAPREHEDCTLNFCLKVGLLAEGSSWKMNGFQFRILDEWLVVLGDQGKEVGRIKIPKNCKINDLVIHRSGRYLVMFETESMPRSTKFEFGDISQPENSNTSQIRFPDSNIHKAIWELGALSRTGRYLLANFRIDLPDPVLGEGGAWALRQWKVYDLQNKSFVADGIDSWPHYFDH